MQAQGLDLQLSPAFSRLLGSQLVGMQLLLAVGHLLLELTHTPHAISGLHSSQS